MSEFLGIARERVYSPGKVADDRAILETVAARLGEGHRVRVVDADDGLDGVMPAPIVFAMCQGPAALAAMRRWEADGVRIINCVAGIENTHRRRMLAAFERDGVPHPDSTLVRADPDAVLPDWVDADVWIKRGDVHATDPDDVVRVSGRADARRVLAAFAARGITAALVQRHVEGEVVKFYAVRRAYFAAFPDAAGDLDAMRGLAEAGAASLELEVFGGDCVRDSQGGLWLIDLNDWPSYGRCRIGAADAIAAYLTAQARAK